MVARRDTERESQQAGLRTHEWVYPETGAFPCVSHSGVMPVLCSFTVAGAASE